MEIMKALKYKLNTFWRVRHKNCVKINFFIFFGWFSRSPHYERYSFRAGRNRYLRVVCWSIEFHVTRLSLVLMRIFPSFFFLYSCPFFRNEIGGEGERRVNLSRYKDQDEGGSSNAYFFRGRPQNAFSTNGNSIQETCHRPPEARNISVLEWNPGTTHWSPHTFCPYSKSSRQKYGLEAVDMGATYYERYFYKNGK